MEVVGVRSSKELHEKEKDGREGDRERGEGEKGESSITKDIDIVILTVCLRYKPSPLSVLASEGKCLPSLYTSKTKFIQVGSSLQS